MGMEKNVQTLWWAELDRLHSMTRAHPPLDKAHAPTNALEGWGLECNRKYLRLRKLNFRRKMGQARLTVLLLAVLIGVTLACVPPDCDTPDCGSCGK